MSSINHLTPDLSPLHLLLPPELAALLREAARLTNASPNEFALSALAREAQATIEKNDVIYLSNRDRDNFLAALDDQDTPNEALQRAFQRHQEIIGS
jgi:uncharacterized protein (DUF1778 family)